MSGNVVQQQLIITTLTMIDALSMLVVSPSSSSRVVGRQQSVFL